MAIVKLRNAVDLVLVDSSVSIVTGRQKWKTYHQAGVPSHLCFVDGYRYVKPCQWFLVVVGEMTVRKLPKRLLHERTGSHIVHRVHT